MSAAIVNAELLLLLVECLGALAVVLLHAASNNIITRRPVIVRKYTLRVGLDNAMDQYLPNYETIQLLPSLINRLTAIDW